MSASLRRRLTNHWPLEPGDGLLIVLATMLGLVWAFIAFALALDFVNPSLGISNVGDVVRVALLLPWFMLMFMFIALQWIGYALDSGVVLLLIAASGLLPGAIAGLIGVAWLHRG